MYTHILNLSYACVHDYELAIHIRILLCLKCVVTIYMESGVIRIGSHCMIVAIFKWFNPFLIYFACMCV